MPASSAQPPSAPTPASQPSQPGPPAAPAPSAPRLADPLAAGTVGAPAWTDEALLEGLHLRGGMLASRPDSPVADIRVHGCRCDAARFTAVVFNRAELVDVDCHGVDLSGTHWTRSRWERVALEDCRASGADLAGATLRDVAVRGGRANELSLRFASCVRLSFTDVDMRGFDAYEADLRGATFTGCDLTGAQFGRARCAGAALHNCTLQGIQGVEALAGASVASTDLMVLSHVFAQALGIHILA